MYDLQVFFLRVLGCRSKILDEHQRLIFLHIFINIVLDQQYTDPSTISYEISSAYTIYTSWEVFTSYGSA